LATLLWSHINCNFTRTVAERCDFDEAERDLEFFGYNPVDDTGKEWYCQPVDELIYQEYSDSHVTTFDYLPSSNIQSIVHEYKLSRLATTHWRGVTRVHGSCANLLQFNKIVRW